GTTTRPQWPFSGRKAQPFRPESTDPQRIADTASQVRAFRRQRPGAGMIMQQAFECSEPCVGIVADQQSVLAVFDNVGHGRSGAVQSGRTDRGMVEYLVEGATPVERSRPHWRNRDMEAFAEE